MELTPGCSAAKSVQLRPLSGNTRTVVSFTVALMLELANSTVGASVETSTVCEIWPTRSAKSNTCCAPTVSMITVDKWLYNPFSDDCTSKDICKKLGMDINTALLVL